MLPAPQQPGVPPAGRELRRFMVKLAAVTMVVPLTVALSVLSMLTAAALFSGVTRGPADPLGDVVSVGGTEGAADWVLAVAVDGPIISAGGGGLGRVSDGAELRELLEKAAADNRVAAVVLELSTPGGTIPGSMDVAAGVAAVQEAGKPVVAYVVDLAASGGMWAMAGADRIVAHPGSAVGSVGVIFGPLRVYRDVTSLDDGLFSGGVTAGSIDEFYVTAGRGKDLGNPFRELTADELTDLQTQVDGVYDDFVAHVAAHRPVSEAELRRDLGARVLRAEDAVAAGLVDQLGSRRDAWDLAGALAGVESFDVRAADRSSGFLGGLFAAGGTEDARPSAGLTALCGPAPQAQVFYGDLLAWCRRPAG